MKQFFSILFLLHSVLYSTVQAQQNIVPNPSFEEYTSCPIGFPDLQCNDWTSFRASPDYFNDCSDICGYNNNRGYQKPRSGQAYTGIGMFQKTVSNAREHIGVELLSPLEIGVKYYVSFYISSGYAPLWINIATNKIGATFTTYQYSDPDIELPLPNHCQIYTQSIITDTVNWVKISGSFIADTAYRYLIIGGFFDDMHIDTVHFPYQVVPQVSFYYLDDVCVSTDSAYTENWTSSINGISHSNDINLFPNPTTGVVNIETSTLMKSIKVSNSIGQELLYQAIPYSDRYSIDLSVLPQGIYYATVELQNNSYTQRKIVINY